MGKSKSIEDKMKEDQEFRKFMAELETESRKEEDAILARIDEAVKKQYEANGWDHARLFGSKQSDYQNYSEWGLSRIMAIIDSIGTALTGGKFPSKEVPGSEDAKKSTIDDAKAFLGAFGGDYSLVIARVQALISGVLAQFSVASNVGRKTSLNDMPLSGGQHLFFGSTGEVFTNNTFFSNQYIASFQIAFEVYMSVDEAKAIGLQQILVTTSRELDILNDLIISIREEQSRSLKEILKKEPEKFVSTKAAYDLAIASVKEDRALLVEEYDRYNQVVETVDHLYPQLDLSDFGIQNLIDNSLPLNTLFNEWEQGIAKRYIGEKIAVMSRNQAEVVA